MDKNYVANMLRDAIQDSIGWNDKVYLTLEKKWLKVIPKHELKETDKIVDEINHNTLQYTTTQETLWNMYINAKREDGNSKLIDLYKVVSNVLRRMNEDQKNFIEVDMINKWITNMDIKKSDILFAQANIKYLMETMEYYEVDNVGIKWIKLMVEYMIREDLITNQDLGRCYSIQKEVLNKQAENAMNGNGMNVERLPRIINKLKELKIKVIV